MINKEQMLLILAILKTAYPRFDDFRDPKRLAAANSLWHRHFQECDSNILEQAIHKYIDVGVYPPTIAEIRMEYKKLIDKFPSADESWNTLMSNIRKYGIYRAVEGVSNLDDIPKKIIKNLGGYSRLCLAENKELEKMQERFCKAYRDEKEVVLDNLMISDNLRIEGKIADVIQ